MASFRSVFLRPADVRSTAPAGRSIVPESPFAADAPNVHAFVYSDLYGTTPPLTRSRAMTVAPVKRGRAVITGSIADLPLGAGAFAGDQFVPANRQPTWLTQTAGTQSPWHRMALTIDDCIFHGWSLWTVERSAADSRQILDASRLSYDRWDFDNSTAYGITVDNRPLEDPASVILFAGPDEGILATGSEVLEGAIAMRRAWVGRVESPIPAMVLQEKDTGGGSRITTEQAEAYTAAWRANRKAPGGAVGFLPANLTMEVFGETTADLFTEGQNNIRLDVANLMNLPASLLDGSTATASLTYTTAQGEFSQLNSWLEYWLAPIEARLSQDDITPHGQLVRFDRSNLSAVAPADSHGPDYFTEPATEAGQE